MAATSGVGGATGATGVNYGNTVFTDKATNDLSAEDFLSLMVTQLANQDFMNPVDDTQFLSQMAQFTSMQQTQELLEYGKQSYVASLVGKTVTAARNKVNGEVESVTGMVDQVSLVDGEYTLSIGDKTFSLEQVMTINAPAEKTAADKTAEDEGGEDEDQAAYPIQTSLISSLLGKPVTVADKDGNRVSAVVQEISGDNVAFRVGERWYSMADLVSIDAAEKAGGEG